MKKIVVLFGLYVLAATGISCAQKETKPTIVIMPKLVGIPYFNATEKGALEAGEALGVEVIYTGPTTADAAEQVRMIEDMISLGVDAIAVAPNDPKAVTPVLKKAKKAGIVVIDWDTPAEPESVDLSVAQIDNQEYAEHIVDSLVKNMGDAGDVAIITGGLSAANLNLWIDLGLAYMEKTYPQLNLVSDRIPSDEKQQVAYAKTLDLLKAYPNIKGIIGYSTPAPLGAAQAVKEKGLEDVVAVVGTTTPKASVEYLESGALDVATLWDSAKLGYLAISIALKLINGEEITDGMNVENVGVITKKGKTIIMGPPTDFTKENAKNFYF